MDIVQVSGERDGGNLVVVRGGSSPKLVRGDDFARSLGGASRGRGGGIFYGWVVVFAVALLLMATSGARFLFGVVLKPISEQYGWDRASLTGAILVATVVISISQPLVGVAVDRWGAKRLLVGGTILLGLALLPLAAARELWQIYLFYGVFASLGLAATSPVIATKIVGRWFASGRGSAMAIATSGAALGQLIIVPAAAWTLTLTDWQTTFKLLSGLLLVVMVPLALVVLREGPPASSSQVAPLTGVSLRVAIASPEFWLLSSGFLVCGFTMAFPNTHFLAYADDMGMVTTHAANAVAITAVFSILGSILLGMAADRWPRSWVLAFTYLLRGAAFAVLLAPRQDLLLLYAVVLGISWTATTPLTAAIAVDRYGTRHLGAIFGTMFMSMNLGYGIGSFFDGVIYEVAGGYRLALLLNALLGVAGAIAILRLPVRRSFSQVDHLPSPFPAD